MNPLAAVTGSTGFLGQHILSALSEAGWRVRLLVRQQPTLPQGADAVELVPGDLSNMAALERLVADADAVIHAAGAIKAVSRSAFAAINVEGTENIAAVRRKRAPSARFVMISSLAARSEHLSDYAWSKAEAERALVAAGGGSTVILRPTAVYGPGDRETLTLFRATGLPVHPIPNSPDARLTIIHARDVATAVVQAASDDRLEGTYELTDANRPGYSWTDLVESACAATGRPFRPARLPGVVTRALGTLGDAISLCSGSTVLPGSQKLRELLHPDWSSSERAQPPAACWRPRIGVRDGFAETVAWYRAAGWLKPKPASNRQ